MSATSAARSARAAWYEAPPEANCVRLPPRGQPRPWDGPAGAATMTGAALTPAVAAMWLFGPFFFLMILRVPVAFALGLACLPVLFIEPRLSPMVVFNTTFKAYNSFILLAVPFFLLTANLMNVGGITDRLVTLIAHDGGQLPRRAGADQRAAVGLLRRHLRVVHGRCGKPGQDLHRSPGQGRVRPEFLDRDNSRVGGACGDHSTFDPDGRVGRRAAGVDRRAVPGRRGAGPPDRPGADGDRARVRQGPPLPDVSARLATRILLRRGRGRSRADDAVHHCRRHPAGLVHLHRVRGGCRDLRRRAVTRLLSGDGPQGTVACAARDRQAVGHRAVLRRDGVACSAGCSPITRSPRRCLRM